MQHIRRVGETLSEMSSTPNVTHTSWNEAEGLMLLFVVVVSINSRDASLAYSANLIHLQGSVKVKV